MAASTPRTSAAATAPTWTPSTSEGGTGTGRGHQAHREWGGGPGATPRLCPPPRSVLDFDFEKLCSISLSHINVYACLVCGKYFQGEHRGQRPGPPPPFPILPVPFSCFCFFFLGFPKPFLHPSCPCSCGFGVPPALSLSLLSLLSRFWGQPQPFPHPSCPFSLWSWGFLGSLEPFLSPSHSLPLRFWGHPESFSHPSYSSSLPFRGFLGCSELFPHPSSLLSLFPVLLGLFGAPRALSLPLLPPPPP